VQGEATQIAARGLEKRYFGYEVQLIQYASLVADYTSRAMTKNTDIVIAFKGTLAAIQPTFRTKFLLDLLFTELEHALLWYLDTELSRRVYSDTDNAVCPS
jgi:hypothetical protein